MKQSYSQKYIYKITNKINNKIYIGQSINPEERFKQHCEKREKYKSLINQAIQKYGKENFEFEILGLYKDYNEKEIYFIDYYNSKAPNGYNIANGGENPPICKGENNPSVKLTNEIVWKVQLELLDESILRKDIIKKYNLTEDEMRHIIAGDCWKRKEFTYPLRRQEKDINEDKVTIIIDLLLNSSLTQKEIAEKVGWSRSAITMINNGQNHKRDNLIYPLRKKPIRHGNRWVKK